MRLRGKVILVTGAGRSMGKAIALGCAREGADVAVNYATSAEAAAAVVRAIESLGRRALAIQADVSDSAQVQAMVAQAVERFGHVDGVANNAGLLSLAPFLEITEGQWDRVQAVDLKGPFLVSQAVARQMVKQGRGGSIVNTTSICAHMAQLRLAHYQAAKGGLRALTRGMAIELAPHKIRVNAIEPGVIVTDINRERYVTEAQRAERVAKVPLGRLGQPEDVVGAVVYLLSDESAFVTGTGIMIDGGETAW